MIKLSRRQFMTTTAACVSASVASRFARSAGPEQVFDFTKPLDGWQTITGNWAVENVPGASRNERALVQRATDNEYNVILAPGGPYRDVGVSVRFKPISGREAGAFGIATHVVPEGELAATATALIQQLAAGPTRSYAATRTLLKAWSSGGVAAADLMMLDVAMELYDGADAQRGFASTAAAFDKDIEPPTLVFEGK